MNITLQTAIRNKLLASGGTEHVYYYYLPSTDLLEANTITFILNLSDNIVFLDSNEGIETYSLQLNINSPSLQFFEERSIYIKTSIYALKPNVVKTVKLINEEARWDEEHNVWTLLMDFELVS